MLTANQSAACKRVRTFLAHVSFFRLSFLFVLTTLLRIRVRNIRFSTRYVSNCISLSSFINFISPYSLISHLHPLNLAILYIFSFPLLSFCLSSFDCMSLFDAWTRACVLVRGQITSRGKRLVRVAKCWWSAAACVSMRERQGYPPDSVDRLEPGLASRAAEGMNFWSWQKETFHEGIHVLNLSEI